MEYSNYVETRTPGSTPTGAELLAASQAGNARQFTFLQISVSAYRGDWDPTGDVLPSSSVLRGFKWRLTADYKGIGSGSTIEAAIDSPATDSDWNFYVTQQL